MAKKLLLPCLALGALIAIGAGSARADADPPGRVGRLSYVEGAVSFRATDQSQWSPATLNYPVLAGESFWTEPASRAEIQIGPAELRLDETTALDILALDDASTRLELDGGVINVHLRALPPGGVQVTTPLGAVDLVEPGSYHIDAGRPQADAPADHLVVTVLEGKAEATGQRSRVEILPGESAIVAGNPLSLTLSEGNPTPFDDWALQRERRERVFAAQRYVSPQETGYQDLDDYGRWSSDPTYGAVWYPTAVPADWAPYRYGHWAWVAPWGWTWIDDAPWGFAPFHYGRWAEIDGRWAWCPGTIAPRPVYAPALVAFIGGSGFGVTLAGGPTMAAVGWVPLAPFEVYHPYYRTSTAYIRNVNVTSVNRTVIRNITVVNNTTVVTRYANNRAATVVPSTAFAHAAPVHKAALTVPRGELARARVTPNMGHVQPSAAARAGVAMPTMAERAVPQPNAPASLTKVTPGGALPRLGRDEEPAVPKAPGPSFAPHPATPAFARRPPPATPPRDAINHPAPPTSPTASTPPGGGINRAVPATTTPASTPPGASAGHTPATPPQAGTPPGPSASRAPATPPQAGTPPGPSASRAPATPPQAGTPPGPSASHAPATPPGPPAGGAPATAATPNAKPPVTAVDRPAQQTRLAPTPQGWVRGAQPAQPAQPASHPASAQPASHPAPAQPASHPAPAHASPPPGEKANDDHKPNG